MSQAWYSQHGPAATVAHPPQQPSSALQHHRFHHGIAQAPGPAIPQVPAASYPRSSPPVGRPPSSASTSSNSSYPPAPGPAPGAALMSRPHQTGSGMSMGGGARTSGHPNAGPQQLGPQTGIRPMARYPMPPRNGVGHPIRPVARGALPPRQHHNGAPPPGPGPLGHGPAAQPLRPLGGAGMHENTHSGHSQFAPKASANGMMQPGRGPMHHRVQYHRVHHLTQTNGAPPFGAGYHHNSRGNGYHQGPPPPQHHESGFQQYVRPYESPESSFDHQAVSRSPSPPPPPPTAFQSRSTSSASLERVVSQGSVTGHNPLQERKNTQSSNDALHQKSTSSEDPTADAASILLQLSAVIKKDENVENQRNKANTGTADKSMLPPPRTDPAKTFQDEGPSNMLKPIEESSSCDEVSTAAPSESTESAPELTSEPSSDSAEPDSEFPAPIPDNYPTRLALPYDETKLNSLHCFLRSELLEIFVVQKSLNKSPMHSPGSSVGRVGLRCVHCAQTRKQRDDRDEAPMAVFYPKSIAEIYRLVTSWQRCHLRKCRNLPPPVRSKWQSLRENDKSRGKTHYWITSAKEIGLIDCQSRAGGIRFGPNTNNKTCTPAPTPTPTPAPPKEHEEAAPPPPTAEEEKKSSDDAMVVEAAPVPSV